jgi:energy-converting hydrogenase Eha subunit F
MHRSQVGTHHILQHYITWIYTLSLCNQPQPLAPVDRANIPITSSATLLTTLPANNSWRNLLQALLDRLHTGLKAIRTNIA